MPIEMESTTVKVNISCTDAVQLIVELTIASITQQGKRTVKTMEIVGIIPPTDDQTTINHAASTASVMTTGVMVAVMNAVEPRKSSIAKTNGIAKSTSCVLTRTRNAV